MDPRGYAVGAFAVDWEERVDMVALRAERLQRAQGALASAGLDAALLWKMENVRFVTALRSQIIAGKASILNGVLLTPTAGPFLLASGGEVDRARFMPWLAQVHAVPVMEDRSLVEGFVAAVLEPLLGEVGVRQGRLGVDQVTVPLLEAISSRLPGLAVVDGDAALLAARRRKSSAEIALVEEACAIGDAVTARAVEETRVGRRECEVAGDALQTLYYLGGELPHVVTPFVASGEHMAPPHRFATDKLIRNRDLCFIDIGAMWNGYFADIGRTTVVGRPTVLQRRVYQAVHEALWDGIEAARPGRTTEHVAEAVRSATRRHRLEEHLFSLFIGHGIGVGANEPPYIGETLPGSRPVELEPGMLFALEPLVWVPEEGGVGVRLEDMVLVTDDQPRVLSRAAYDEELLA